MHFGIFRLRLPTVCAPCENSFVRLLPENGETSSSEMVYENKQTRTMEPLLA